MRSDQIFVTLSQTIFNHKLYRLSSYTVAVGTTALDRITPVFGA